MAPLLPPSARGLPPPRRIRKNGVRRAAPLIVATVASSCCGASAVPAARHAAFFVHRPSSAIGAAPSPLLSSTAAAKVATLPPSARIGVVHRAHHRRRTPGSLGMLIPSSGMRSAAATSPLFRSVAVVGRTSAAATTSPLFGSPLRGRRRSRSPNGARTGVRRGGMFGRRAETTTELGMVLTTPENIIEQASTQNLLDELIDESVRTSSRKPIMMQFNPSSGWIWRRWKGTVFSETWTSCVRNMFFASIVAWFYRSNPRFMEAIGGFNILWGQLLSVTTFTLTFFLNQSYALWRKCYELSRRLQGRLNDLGLALAAHAARKTPSSPDESAEFTSSSRQLLELVSRYIRLFNLLTYASFTRSHRPILTPRGMRRLVERGIVTAQERQVLVDTELPATQRHNAVLLWIVRVFVEARQAGLLGGGAGFEQQFMEKVHVIRAQYGAIADELQGRMPLAYAHIVQVLVDVILWMYPFMAFSTGMTPVLGVLGTGLLTIFYQGLFDLAKQFLDPYDNENYGKGEDPLCVDTLIAETNAGSVRWMHSFEEQPFSAQRLKDGELFDYLLPLRGYSVAELIEKEEREEAERLKKEQEREEAERLRKEQEEAERLQKEQEEVELSVGANETVVAEEEMVAENADEEEYAKTGLLDTVEESAQVKANVTGIGDAFVPSTLFMETSRRAPDVESEAQKVVVVASGAKEVSMDTEDLVAANGNVEEVGVAIAEKVVSKLGDNTVSKADTANETVNGLPAMVVAVNGDSNEDMHEPTISSANGDAGDVFVRRGSLNYTELANMVDWFEEKGPDGQEYRLSQLLADEEWEEELEYQAEKEEKKPMTMEDFTIKAAEIIEAAENELLETEEILKASPGSQTGTDRQEEASKKKTESSVTVRKGDVERYDQTKLDGISQLWGAPPDVLDMPTNNEPMQELRYEDYNFDGISQLWGGSLDGGSEPTPKEPSNVEDAGFSGIEQLWGEQGRITGEDNDGSEAKGQRASAALSAYDDDDGSEIGGLWFDEVDQDGKEYRLSQMLADEVWEEEILPEPTEVLTLEEYTEQAARLAERAEDEFLETEAILNAPPGASTIDVPDDKEELQELEEKSSNLKEVPASEETAALAESVMELAEKVAEEAEEQMEKRPAIDDDVLEVLEMDVEEGSSTDDEDEENGVSEVDVENETETPEEEASEPDVDSDAIDGSVHLGYEDS